MTSELASNRKFHRTAPLASVVFGMLIGLAACGEAVYDTIALMPPPAVYAQGQVDPFPERAVRSYAEQSQLFFATDRRPVQGGEPQAYYANDRGGALRVGTVEVRADPPFSGWEEVRAVSTSQVASPPRKLRVTNVTEFGALPIDGTLLVRSGIDAQSQVRAGQQFAAQINAKLATSRQKDIFLYVHGYNVDFEYPVLSSRELQHYLGYRGAFVTYAWPATPNRFAYFKDLETTDATRRNLRELILFLSDNTRAEKIHIIGYSAGSRLTFETLYDLALRYPEGSSGGPRLGHYVMIGSEMDRDYFVQAIDDGLLGLVDNLTIYMSATDAALRMSSLVLGRDRLGQVSRDDKPTDEATARILSWDGLDLIDVTAAEGSNVGSGHEYFRSSPWASSDMFVSLMYDLTPQERGLVRAEGAVLWEFPDNYPDRIVRAAAARQD